MAEGARLESVTYGIIGVKCWIFKGDVAEKEIRKGTLGQRAGDEPAR